jgi:hypothetical protein
MSWVSRLRRECATRRAKFRTAAPRVGIGWENPPENARIQSDHESAVQRRNRETGRFAGRNRAKQAFDEPLAMQKVVGSSPIIRSSRKPC